MGIKHCGKSTQGKLLAAHFSCPFFDTDDEVTALTGKTPRELYVQQGKNAFMQAEAQVCKQLSARFSVDAADSRLASAPSALACAAKEPLQTAFSCVIATGGGIANNEPALQALASCGVLVFLQADEKLACDRIIREISFDEAGALKNAPAYIASEHPATLADVRAIFHRFYEERTALYTARCNITVQMTSLPPEQNRERILQALRTLLGATVHNYKHNQLVAGEPAVFQRRVCDW
mgnify:CR=1 FL=1